METIGPKPIIKQKRFWILFIIAIIAIGYVMNQSDEGVADAPETTVLPAVQVSTADELSGTEAITLIGAVRAFTEANVTAERGGRVTNVSVSLGDAVRAGQIIATLENAAEQAAVLQAEGVYEAALSAAAQNDVGTDEAETALVNAQNSAVNALRNSFNTVNDVILNNIDTFFTDPQASVPGLRLDGRGNVGFLNAERVAYESLLPNWQANTQSLTTDSDLDSALPEAQTHVARTLTLVDTFVEILNTQSGSNNDGIFTDDELKNFSSTFIGLRSSLTATQNSLDAALTGLDSARDGIRRAELAATGGASSAADAQVKQALGSLRAAQASLAETILRSPISGTVNSLDIRSGDFISAFSSVAEVANNNALEIVTFVGERERSAFAVGEELLIERTATGTVTHISPAVDSITGKTEIRISAENTDIQNGDTVSISKTIATGEQTDTVLVPLSAVKFEIEDGFIFTIEDGLLTAKPVTLGPVRGGLVEITSGLSSDDPFVLDARGLIVGTAVTINQ